VAAVRDALPAVRAGIYLNTPVSGPLPAESAAAMDEIAGWELRTGRANRERAEDVLPRIEEAQAAVAAIVGADLDAVRLTHGLADAASTAFRTVAWHPGDAMLIGDDEATGPLAALVPPGVQAQRLALPPDPAALVESLTEQLGRTPARLVVLPLVTSAVGARLPIKAVAVAARERGAATLVDASLAVGAIPVDVAALGVDLLIARSEAWLLGPEGLGFVVGPRAALPPTASGGFHLPSVVGFARGCGWLSMYVGLEWIYARAAALTSAAATRLGAIEGVEVLTPEARATTLAFRVRGWGAEAALEELGPRVFLLASAVPSVNAIRIGIGPWNTEEEIERVTDAVALLAADGPDTLPRRRRLMMLGQEG
jgi:selenocysteine lyase/cysteine desulfurase